MRNYIIIESVLLLAIGMFGFAFKDYFKTPSLLLLVMLGLGIWGIWVLFGNKQN